MQGDRVITAVRVIRGVKNPSHVGLAGRLRSARRTAGLSLRGLAERAGMDGNVVRSIEAGGVPLLDTVARIAAVLGVSPCLLAYNVDVPPSPGHDLQHIDVGQRLHQVRTAHSLTKNALGKLAGVSGQTVANIEIGKGIPSVATIEKLAKALGCDPCWLAYGAGRSDLAPWPK